MGSRRGESTVSSPMELLVVDKSPNSPVPTPPHPSTLEPADLLRPKPAERLTERQREESVLLHSIVGPLEGLGLVADTTVRGMNVWQGWVRVPKKGEESWESRKERLEGIQALNGDFCLVNITYVSSSRSDLRV